MIILWPAESSGYCLSSVYYQRVQYILHSLRWDFIFMRCCQNIFIHIKTRNCTNKHISSHWYTIKGHWPQVTPPRERTSYKVSHYHPLFDNADSFIAACNSNCHNISFLHTCCVTCSIQMIIHTDKKYTYTVNTEKYYNKVKNIK